MGGFNDQRRPGRGPMLRFKGRDGSGRLVWQRQLRNDSRVEQITANAEWFYGTMGRRS